MIRHSTRGVLPLLVLLSLAMAPVPAAAQGWPADPWLEEPVDDATFRTFAGFFSYDADVPLDARVEARDESDGIVRERLSFISTPGERVPATFVRPSSGDWRERPALILIHGGSENGQESAYMRALADAAVRHGMTALTFDLEHFGARASGLLTSFSETDKHQHLYNRPGTYLAWVIQSVKDTGRARDLLVQERYADPDRVGVVGISRGGQIATIAGGVNPRIEAVGLIHSGHFDALEREHEAAACPANYVGRIAPRPLYMMNGLYDRDYDPERSIEPIHRLAKEPVEIDWVESGHSAPSDEALDRMFGWFTEQLRR